MADVRVESLVNELMDNDFEIRLLLEAIYEKYSYDFRNYSMTSVRRRIALVLRQHGFSSVSSLQERVLHDSGFFSELLQYMTIPTSEMFRDPEFFRQIREQVVPVLQTYPSLKVWIAGCSTGEEVYSYAIILHEADLLKRTTIYATDINPRSLKKAEQGIFPIEKIKDYATNYRKSGGSGEFTDYLVSDSNAVIFDRKLKENIVFADHSLATDSVFSEMHLVSCRNVLIYFNRDLQNRALGLFKDSLVRRGFLGIGSKESLRFSEYEKDFEFLPKSEKIYRKNEARDDGG